VNFVERITKNKNISLSVLNI